MLSRVLVVWLWTVTAGRVDVLVLTVERMVEYSVLVSPFKERVATDVPCISTRIVEVETGRVVDFETIFVV